MALLRCTLGCNSPILEEHRAAMCRCGSGGVSWCHTWLEVMCPQHAMQRGIKYIVSLQGLWGRPGDDGDAGGLMRGQQQQRPMTSFMCLLGSAQEKSGSSESQSKDILGTRNPLNRVLLGTHFWEESPVGKQVGRGTNKTCCSPRAQV